MKKLTLLTAMLCLVLMACQKNNTPQPDASPAAKSISAAALAASADCLRRTPVTDVYVTGNYQLALPAPQSAAYWKNGTLVNLAPAGTASDAAGIAVKGNDVYVVGDLIENGGSTRAVYWKNGVMHPLNYGCAAAFGSYAVDIALDGNDVYIVGDYTVAGQKSQAILWKNGVPQNLSYNQFGSGAHFVKVIDHDVYVAGYSALDNTVTDIATYWKNGFNHRLENNTGFSFTSGMAVNGNDVYIAGMTFPTANGINTVVYWKNGIRTNVKANASAGGIAIGSNNVYIAGTTVIDATNFLFQATYWKNGTPTLLGGIGGTAFGRDIQVAGNDVYLLAIEGNSTVYYKNGVAVPIGSVNPARILVVQH
jgi:hypothetical protein